MLYCALNSTETISYKPFSLSENCTTQVDDVFFNAGAIMTEITAIYSLTSKSVVNTDTGNRRRTW